MNALEADLIPDPTTAGDFTRRFAEADVLTLMEAFGRQIMAVGGHPIGVPSAR